MKDRGKAVRGAVGLEAMVVVVLLLAIATVAIPLFLNRSTINRDNITHKKILEIKKAIIGDSSIFEGVSRTSFGFVGDVGVLPASTDGLTDLVENTAGMVVYPAWQQEPVTGLWYGWNGPYLDNKVNQGGNFVALLDAWGRTVRYLDLDGIPSTWDAEIRSAGPDGLFDNADDIFVNINEDEVRSYVSGTFRDRTQNPVEEDGVTVYFPNGTTGWDSVQITKNPGDENPYYQYNSATDTVSDPNSRKIPIGNRYFETQKYEVKKLAALNGGSTSIVNFVTTTAASSGPFFERNFYPTDDTDPQTGSPITELTGNWETDGMGNYYAAGGQAEYRAAFGRAEWEDYRLEVDATLYQGRGYGIYYRSDGQPNITGYIFQYDPGLHTPLGSGIEFVVRKVYQGNENYFPPAQRFLVRVQMDSAQFFSMFNSNIYNDSHHISITVNGDRHIIKVDGQVVIDVTDTEPLFPCGGLCGMPGLRSWDGQRYTDFHHLLVYGIPPLPTGEFVWWSFEEGGGPRVYGSGFLIGAPEINGTIVNPANCDRSWNNYNIHGQSINLDDSSSGFINFGDVLDFDPTDTFSISLWARMPSINPANDYVIFSKKRNQSNYRGWELKLARESGHGFGAEFTLGQRRGGGNPRQLIILNDLNGSGLQADEWYHIVVVYDGSGYSGGTTIDPSALRIYVTAQSSNLVNPGPALYVVEQSLTANANTVNNENLQLGLDNNGGSGFYGDIDEVKFYYKALTLQEIEELFQEDK